MTSTACTTCPTSANRTTALGLHNMCIDDDDLDFDAEDVYGATDSTAHMPIFDRRGIPVDDLTGDRSRPAADGADAKGAQRRLVEVLTAAGQLRPQRIN
jgi:hypothetical protein